MASGSPVPLPEQTGNLVRLSGVKINTLLSGGKDRDGQPGDDLLVALISPHDQQGDLVKIAGEIEIEAYDMTRSGDNKRVGYWTFDPTQSAKAWHSGFVGAGLQFELPWQEAPSNKELLVHVRLRTSDGRQFDTSSPLKVIPPANATPGLISVPQAQPVKHETEKAIDREILTAVQQVPEEPMARPVPFYEDVEPNTARPFPGADQPTAGEKTSPPVRPATPTLKSTTPATPPLAPAKQPPGHATLDGIETSDSWTDETIPRLR